MEILSLDFFSALAAIVVIDLMLAGDNAIVIALAARNVPAHLQKRAIAWGTGGAIIVRSLMTLIVVWLLQIPGLLFVGGAILVWIAYKLLIPDDGHAGHELKGTKPTGFWSAMRTIIVADAVMGLDNVLAVAGAAHGSYVLVILGLAISVPIVVWGSSLLLKWVERYPAIVYVGAAVLAYTAVKMMLEEPFLRDTAREHVPLSVLAYLTVMLGVLYAGFVRNHHTLESRIHARLATRLEKTGGEPMKNVLVPIGDRNAEVAIRHVIREYLAHPGLEIHILNVQRPFSRHVSQFTSRRNREDFHREESERALEPARVLLAQHNIPYTVHLRVGDRANGIAGEARRLHVDHIIMATARKNSLTRMLEDSTTNRLLELTPVPVEVVAGEKISRLERYGVPAGIGAAVALMVAAVMD
jgi:YjbE family integral membrane protein